MVRDVAMLEFQLVQTKLSEAVSELQKIELYTAFSTGVFYAWYFSIDLNTTPHRDLITYTLFVPVWLILLGSCRMIMQLRYIRKVAGYVRKLEAILYEVEENPKEDVVEIVSPRVGWERYFDCEKRTADKYFAWWTRAFRLAFWGGTFFLSLGVSIAANLGYL